MISSTREPHNSEPHNSALIFQLTRWKRVLRFQHILLNRARRAVERWDSFDDISLHERNARGFSAAKRLMSEFYLEPVQVLGKKSEFLWLRRSCEIIHQPGADPDLRRTIAPHQVQCGGLGLLRAGL